MHYIPSQDRFQIHFQSMEDRIDKDNPVRFIDAFINQLDFAKLGFTVVAIKAEGSPAFDPAIFLKLYFYGYLNGLRSSPKLEREAVFFCLLIVALSVF